MGKPSKANGSMGISNVILAQGARKCGHPCVTCSRKAWIGAVRDALEGMISGEIPAATSRRRIFDALRDNCNDLNVPYYNHSLSALINHITGCEHERWRQVQALRDQWRNQ